MTTTKEVRKAFDSLDTVEFQTSDLANGIRVAASETEAGLFFKTLRVNELDAQTRRIGDTLVANIAAEESGGLGDLFR